MPSTYRPLALPLLQRLPVGIRPVFATNAGGEPTPHVTYVATQQRGP